MARKKKGKINKKNLVVILSATIILFLALALFLYFKPGGTIAGKAVDLGAQADISSSMEWGILHPAQKVFGSWTNDLPEPDQLVKDTVDVEVYVNFPDEGPGKFKSFKLKLNYDPTKLGSPQIIPDPKFNAPADPALQGWSEEDDEDSKAITATYKWSGTNAAFQSWDQPDSLTILTVRFDVLLAEPDEDNQGVNGVGEGGAVVWLSSVPATVASGVSDQFLGAFWGSEDLEQNVQLLNPDPVSPNLEIILMRPCKDKDGDTWINNLVPACPDQDKSGDCNDENAAINPGATDICNGINDDCNGDTADGSGELAPLNSKQQGICFETTQTCVSDNVGGADWQDNFPEGYNVEEQCDFIDHDCDGKPNTQTNDANEEIEIEGCQIGGAAGLPFDAGNLYVDGWNLPVDGEAQPDEDNQLINYIDATIVSIQEQLQNTEDNNGGLPLCVGFGAGKICVCNNGDYWRAEQPDDNIDYKVNYVDKTKTKLDLIIVNNVLKNGGENVQCPQE